MRLYLPRDAIDPNLNWLGSFKESPLIRELNVLYLYIVYVSMDNK